MNLLYGEQVPITIGGDEFIQYLTVIQNPNPPNAMSSMSVIIAKALLKNITSYDTLDELIADRSLLPDNTEGYPVEMLRRHIMQDTRRSPSNVYSELGIIAYSGFSSLDRPVTMISIGPVVKFYPTPDFNKLVKRL